jgi:hypothetical protein
MNKLLIGGLLVGMATAGVVGGSDSPTVSSVQMRQQLQQGNQRTSLDDDAEKAMQDAMDAVTKAADAQAETLDAAAGPTAGPSPSESGQASGLGAGGAQ